MNNITRLDNAVSRPYGWTKEKLISQVCPSAFEPHWSRRDPSTEQLAPARHENDVEAIATVLGCRGITCTECWNKKMTYPSEGVLPSKIATPADVLCNLFLEELNELNHERYHDFTFDWRAETHTKPMILRWKSWTVPMKKYFRAHEYEEMATWVKENLLL